MENKCKRFLSLLLALVMVLGMMPPSHVHAEEGETFSLITEKVSLVKADRTYVICLAGSMKAMTNKQGSGAWNTNTLVTAVLTNKAAETKNMWTLEAAQGGYKIKNGDKYLEVKRNAAELTDNGHVFELVHTNAGWTIKSLANNEYFNNLGSSGSIGGWSGDGTKFDLYKVVEYPVAADPFGKLRGCWTKINVDSEAVGKNNAEGEFWKAFDSNPNTHWHSNYPDDGNDKVNGTGNTIAGEIDLGKEYLINQFSFSPRQDSADSGQVTQASLYVKSAADTEWQLVEQSKTFEPDKTKKSFDFEARDVRYVKFVAENAKGGWVTVSEFDISGPGVEQPTTANAKILSNNKVISLESCEYVLGGEVNGSYSLVHEGTYYVKPRATSDAKIPQAANAFSGLTLVEGKDGAININGDGGGMHFHTSETKPYWNRCSGNNDAFKNDSDHQLYLFKADANSTDGKIPGYTMVTLANIKPGESYLIAAKKSQDNWFVMVPSVSTEKFNHIAQVVPDYVTHEHDLVRTVKPATCTEDGLEADRCDICDHYHAIQVFTKTGHAPEERAKILPTLNEAGREAGTFCTNCDTFISGGAVIPALTPKNAKPLMDIWRDNNRGVVSLSDCEYVLSGTEGAYSLCHNGTYYVNPSNGGGIPQEITPFAGLSLRIADDGKVNISGGGKTLQVNNVNNAVDLNSNNKYHPWWHNFGKDQADSTTTFYLLKANPDSTNTDIPGYDIVTKVAEGESYLIAFKNDFNEWFVMYPSTETVALAMIVQGNGEFEISYSNMSMGNSLAMKFAFESNLVENWADYYAVIEKDYAYGRGTKTQTVAEKDWGTMAEGGISYRTVDFKGVAAKEMTDEFRVVIYNPQGEAVSTVYTDTVAEYAQRSMKKDSSENNVRMVVDMLNYGAEAQKLAGYNMDHLANAGLTDAQKALATQEITLENTMNCTEGFEYKANVKMVSNLQFMMAFTGINPDTMTAIVKFNDWRGNRHEITYGINGSDGKEFVESGKFHYITIEETVVADGRQTITCEIYEGENLICTVTDSIESYAYRTAETNKSLYKAIMMFSDSARTYLEGKNPQSSESR